VVTGELNEITATEAVRRVVAGDTTAMAVLEECLARIALREPEVGAFAYLDRDLAIAQARAVDGGMRRGPLTGATIGVKDVLDTFDMPTACGSPIYANNRPPADASAVALLRAAGAVIVGKTVTAEFATLKPGKTRHPLDATRTPGGSSSGSAAGVADNMIHLAVGTQTMGSVIRPATYCGVVGYKPSYGLVGRAGMKTEAEALDTLGFFGRSIDDVALIGSVAMGAAPESFAGVVTQPPRITVYKGPDWSNVEPAANKRLDAVVDLLRERGATIADGGDPQILRSANDAQLVILLYELARSFMPEWLEHRALLSEALIGLIELGLAKTFDEYLDALAVARDARAWMTERFAQTDLWLTLGATGEAPVGFDTGNPILNRLGTVLHVPVLTIPAGRGPHGLPLGIQLLGQYGCDRTFFRSARWIAAQLAQRY
jgi:Asp-tRNA(Asn)/Glu-tRNA(Gln) amidotransferase A subunit family amidase